MAWPESGGLQPPSPPGSYAYDYTTNNSGVTTDPADPAMRGGPRAYGGPKLGLWH